MSNEMRRPCVITHPVVVNDGKPFDALDLNSEAFDTIRSDDAYFMYFLNEKIGVVDTYYDASLVYRNIMWQLAQALNPPIKVTQAVLNAMKDAGSAYIAKSILVDAPDYSYNLHFDKQKKAFTFRGGMAFDVNEQDVPIYTVQADCPLALQVLLQFNTEGETHA